MISVIVPFYNTEKYLEECLYSLRIQTFFDFEVLMIDDGSTDSSREIALKYSIIDSRFRLLGDKHIGFPLSKNLGLDNAKGDYICFVDSDDYVESNYLEYLYKGLIETKADICCCKFRIFNTTHLGKARDKDTITQYDNQKMSLLFRSEGSSFMWNKIFKKEIFDDIRFEDVMALSDTMICYKLFERASRITTISRYLINHRHHKESMTYRMRHYEENYWKHRLKVYLDMCSYLYNNYNDIRSLVKRIFKNELSNIESHIKVDYNKDMLILLENQDE